MVPRGARWMRYLNRRTTVPALAPPPRFATLVSVSCHVNGMSCQIPIDDKHLRDELILAVELIGAMFSLPRRIFERVKVEATR